MSMRKLRRTVLSILLCLTMAVLPAGKAMASSTNTNQQLYISEIKIGMGETALEAADELLSEGYTILLDENGLEADLNYETGTKSGLKEGPVQKIVYLGYKTTTDPNDAITDLAVMNMNGGYSTKDYNVLMNNYMEGQIKPFVDRFVAALKEYRENYYKPEGTLGYIRAHYYCEMLNKLTDDDTGGQPLGTLLLNQTKYEMGDKYYDRLSEEGKKGHADILTLLTQGNGRAILLLETLIIRAADSSDDTWLDRFLSMDLETLTDNIKAKYPYLTTEEDILAELDKTYNDTAMKLLSRWDAFSEQIANCDNTFNEVANAEGSYTEDLQEKIENMDVNHITDKDVDTVANAATAQANAVSNILKAEETAVIQYIESVAYQDGSLLEFFQRDRNDFSGEGIRELYPMAAALSPGQIAGLDFLSIKDLLTIAFTDADGYNTLDLDNIPEASVFQDVDRAIYEPGGVGLTNATLRSQKNELDSDSGFVLSDLGIVFWSLSAAFCIGTIASLVPYLHYASFYNPALTAYNIDQALIAIWAPKVNMAYNNILTGVNCELYTLTLPMAEGKVASATADAAEQMNIMSQFGTKTHLTQALSAGFAALTAMLSAVAIWLTVSQMLAYYDVKFTPIPKYMVDEADITTTVNGKTVVINNATAYYKVVECNRKPGSTKVEQQNYKILGTANDLNGDVGKQWLALYSVKYEQGKPILADSLKFVSGINVAKPSALPAGYETGIHRFGEGAAFNLTSEFYCYNDKPNGTYVYYKNADKTVEEMTGKNTAAIIGSLFSNGSLMIGAGAGVLVGAVTVVIIMTAARKRKEDRES